MPHPPELARVARARRRRIDTDGEWTAAIVAAADAGHSLRAIAAVAGVSNPRVHTIIAAARRRQGGG